MQVLYCLYCQLTCQSKVVYARQVISVENRNNVSTSASVIDNVVRRGIGQSSVSQKNLNLKSNLSLTCDLVLGCIFRLKSNLRLKYLVKPGPGCSKVEECF